MGEYRSNSYSDGGWQIERYNGAARGNTAAANTQDFIRSYSANNTYTSTYTQNKDKKFNKAKSSSSRSKIFSDPEFQRKKRVASYKVYSIEGKVKGSFRKSFTWLKDRFYAWL